MSSNMHKMMNSCKIIYGLYNEYETMPVIRIYSENELKFAVNSK